MFEEVSDEVDDSTEFGELGIPCATVLVVVTVEDTTSTEELLSSTDNTLPRDMTPFTPCNKLSSCISASVKLGLTPPKPLKAEGSNHVLPCPFSINRALSRLAAHAIGLACPYILSWKAKSVENREMEGFLMTVIIDNEHVRFCKYMDYTQKLHI